MPREAREVLADVACAVWASPQASCHGPDPPQLSHLPGHTATLPKTNSLPAHPTPHMKSSSPAKPPARGLQAQAHLGSRTHRTIP